MGLCGSRDFELTRPRSWRVEWVSLSEEPPMPKPFRPLCDRLNMSCRRVRRHGYRVEEGGGFEGGEALCWGRTGGREAQAWADSRELDPKVMLQGCVEEWGPEEENGMEYGRRV